MWFLSFFSRGPHPTMPHMRARQLDLLTDYPGVLCPTVHDLGPGRSPVEVIDPPAELLADYRYPQLSAMPMTLEDYRAALRYAHDQRLREITIGIVVGGRDKELPATIEYQQYLTDAYCLAAVAERPIWVAVGDETVEMTRRQLRDVVQSYYDEISGVTGRYTSEIIDHVALRGRIESATAPAHLDAITID